MNKRRIDLNVRVREAKANDLNAIVRLFWEHVSAETDYICHSTIQMGVADNPDTLAEDGRNRWKRHIEKRLASRDGAVLVSYNSEGIIGFAVLIEESHQGGGFGVLDDILVKQEYRGFGCGWDLLMACAGWLKGKGLDDLYINSGRGNHAAHDFIERQGFRLISHTFHLNINKKPGKVTPE